MKVLKFGGTSVGTPQRMKEVSRLVTEDGQQKLVVLSAMSGTTNSLVEIAQYLYGGNKAGADDVINRLRAKYYAHVPELPDTLLEIVLVGINKLHIRLIFGMQAGAVCCHTVTVLPCVVKVDEFGKLCGRSVF